MGFEKKRNAKDVFLFFLALSVVYVFPIIHADYLYIDDQWRSLLLVDDLWRKQGRVFAELLYGAMTFTSSMPNIFPLPLLVSMIAIAWAMRSLVFYLYVEVDYSKCLVVLPLLCSPFFLGNLTYQYDGPAMVLAVAAMVAAFTIKPENVVLTVVMPALLVTLALGLYQLSVSLFIGLCCLESLLSIHSAIPWRTVICRVVLRALQLASGLLIYYFTAYSLADNSRGRLLAFDVNWIPSVVNRLHLVIDKMSLLNSHGVNWMWALLLLLAGAGGLFFVSKCLARTDRLPAKVGILMIVCLTVMVLLLCTPGVMLILHEDRMDARNLMGFSTLLILLFYLAHDALSRVNSRAGTCLIIPCLYLFSLSYLYGQVLSAKKEYEVNLLTHIDYDLTSRIELREVEGINFSPPDSKSDAYWVPASEGTLALMPVLKYVLSDDNTVLFPDRFKRLGINKVFWVSDSINQMVAQNKGELIVDNSRYRIYRVGNEALIQIKNHAAFSAP